MQKLYGCLFCLTLWLTAASAQDCKKLDYDSELQKRVETTLQQFSTCQHRTDACRSGLAQSLEEIYGVTDFGSGQKYLTPGEIAKKIQDDSAWEHLGSAGDQEVLKKAASAANCGSAVVAMFTSDSGGHVSVILPGALSHSLAWKLDVPNSASFFVNNPAKSFAGRPLSYAFGTPQGVEIYVRKALQKRAAAKPLPNAEDFPIFQ